MLTVFSSFGEFERAIIKERTDKGRKAKMKEGKPMGTPKFGEVVIENVNERIANEDEVKVIEIIRKHRQSGKKANQIAKYLNAQGIPTKRGKQWTQQGVINILDRLYPKSA
jgi:site-specific DNA recombinase